MNQERLKAAAERELEAMNEAVSRLNTSQSDSERARAQEDYEAHSGNLALIVAQYNAAVVATTEKTPPKRTVFARTRTKPVDEDTVGAKLARSRPAILDPADLPYTQVFARTKSKPATEDASATGQQVLPSKDV